MFDLTCFYLNQNATDISRTARKKGESNGCYFLEIMMECNLNVELLRDNYVFHLKSLHFIHSNSFTDK